ncbi:hypothetical protein HGF60_10530 [Alteromonadaceae bacterium A_SAG2]|nr:hypothetical protein [Alteromonadaceae bacterium A_SAG2]
MTIGWKEYKCAELFEQVSTTKLKVKTKDCNPIGKYPVVDQGREKLAGFIDDEKRVISVSSPVCIFGDHTRVIKWIDFDFVPGADGTKILSPKSIINPRFFYYLLQNIPLIDKGYARHFKQLKEASVRVPEKNEQKRIADKLDSVLAKVEAAQARLDKIPAILKRFRQSVLAAATSGELTKEWRGESGLNLSNWNTVTVGDVCSDSFYGPRFAKGDYVDGKDGIPTIRTTDMCSDGTIDIDETTPRVNCSVEKAELYRVKRGDLLITRTGSIGTMAVFMGEYLAIPSAYLIRFRFNEQISVEYLYYYLTSPFGQEKMGLGTTSVAQPNINAKKIKAIELNLPSMHEQYVIIRKVEELFVQAKIVEKQYEAAKARLDKLTQSILAKAFKGELLTSSVGSDIEAIENSVEKLNA